MNITEKNKKIIFCILIILILICGLIYFFISNKNNNYKNEDDFFNANIQNINEGEKESQTNIGQNNNEEDEYIYVHIIGEVRNPGVIKLKIGARIIDAIEAAGGVTEKANTSKVNLAYMLNDGCKIIIPGIDAENNVSIISNDGGKNVVLEGETSGKVNINTATQTELETLTGIGPSIAVKILEYRNKNGRFKKIDDLKKVSGIGEEKYNGLKDEICVK